MGAQATAGEAAGCEGQALWNAKEASGESLSAFQLIQGTGMKQGRGLDHHWKKLQTR